MKKGKRDQRQYDLVQQHLPGLILSTILGIVEDLGDPYRAKPGLGGMTAYPPKAMAVVCILMEAEARTYRKMVGHLRMNRGLAMKIGLPKIPSKSTIWRAYGMIPEPYLREVHTRIIGDVMVTGSVAGDSTGYSSNRFVRWFSIRHDQVRLKRGWVKLHSIVDVSTSNPRCARSSTCESLDHLHHAHEEFNLAWVKPSYSVVCVVICV